MRILYLCSDPGIPVLGAKGASLHVRALVSALAKLGHQVAVATPALTRTPWEAPAVFGIPIEHLPPSDTVDQAGRALKGFVESIGEPSSLAGEVRRILYNEELRAVLKRRLERARPDVILERASLYGTTGVQVAADLGVPLLLELNAPLAVEQAAYRSTELGPLAATAEAYTVSRADAVLAVSAALGEHAVLAGAEPGRVHVLPNGVDPQLFRPGPSDPTFRARWKLNGGPVLGFVGNLRPWHGLESLPPLLEALVPRHPDLRLVLAGDGPLRGELGDAFERRGLSKHVVFTGGLPHVEVPCLLRELDVALAPYPDHDHAFYFSPLKLFEYMACGVPVVAPELGQIAQVARSGETALLYPVSNPVALGQACERLIDDRALRHRLGSAASREVRSRYTWEQNARTIVELAEGLVSGAKVAA